MIKDFNHPRGFQLKMRSVAVASKISLIFIGSSGVVNASTQDLLDLVNGATSDTVKLTSCVEVNSSEIINRPELSFISDINTQQDLWVSGESSKFVLTGDKYSIVRTASYGNNVSAQLNFNEVRIKTGRSQALFHAYGSSMLEINTRLFDAENTNTYEWNANVLRTLEDGSLILNADKALIKSNGTLNSVAPVYAGSNGILKIVSPNITIESASQKAVIAQSKNGSLPSLIIDATQGDSPGKVLIKNHNAQAVQSQGAGVGSVLTIQSHEIRIVNDGPRTDTQYNTNPAVMADGKGVLNLIAEDIYIEGATSLTAVKGGSINISANHLLDLKGDVGTYFTSSWVDPSSENTINLTARPNATVIIHDKIVIDSTHEMKSINIALQEGARLETHSDIEQIAGAPAVSEKSESIISLASGATWSILGDNNHVSKVVGNQGVIDATQTSQSASIKIDCIEGTQTYLPVNDLSMAHVQVGQIKGNLTLVAKGELNDSVNSSAQLLDGLSKIVETKSVEKLTLTAQEGLITDSLTASVTSSGAVSAVQVKPNVFVEAVSNIIENQTLAFRTQINDVNKRMGDLRTDSGMAGAWARIYGGKNKYKADGVTNRYRSVQIGADASLRSNDGRFYMGLTGLYTEGDSSLKNGSADDESFGGGVYGGYLADNGWYLDVIAKYSRMKNDFAFSYTNGRVGKGRYETNGVAASVETGWRLTNEYGVFVEPQFECMVGHVMGFKYDTSAGVHVEHDSMNSLITRFGLSLGKVFDEGRGSAYLNVSILNDYDGQQSATYTVSGRSRKADIDIGGAWFEAALGATYHLSDDFYLYGELATSKGTEVDNPFQWNVGARLSF